MLVLPAALKSRLHAGAQNAPFPHDPHKIVEGGRVQVAGQLAAAESAAAHPHQIAGGELAQDLVGKLSRDQLRFRHLGHRMLLPVQQHPQNAQRVVRLFGDDHVPHPLFACLYCHHINLDKFCQDNFQKIIALTQTAPARVSFAFHSAKSHVPYNYRSRKSCAVAVRRKQKRLCLKTRKRRNWLGLAGVAHPRRMRRSLTSLSHPTETSNKVRAFHFIYADHSWETVEKFPLLLT